MTILHGAMRHGSPSICIGTHVFVVMVAVWHWHTLAPLPPACSMATEKDA
jgi:hypothetical protein